MKRRDFLKTLSAFALTSPISSNQSYAAEELSSYDGPLFVYYRCGGGIDQSSWVDPRADEAINKWAVNGTSYGQAGSVRYAPMANNQSFFEKHVNKMLVINGVNIQSNSHSCGAYRATGQKDPGHPSIIELFSAIHGQGPAFGIYAW